MKVTALRLQTRNPSRVNVHLDGKFAFGLTKLEAALLRLGQELSEADVARLREADNREQVHQRALRLLARRPHSETEIRENLKKHGVPEPLIAAELARLKETGLVNDDAFARLWVENRATFRPRSKRALQAELKRKGISVDLRQTALAATDDAASAAQLATQRARRLKGLPRPEFRRKLAEYLGRRGYDYDTALAAADRAWAELRAAEDGEG